MELSRQEYPALLTTLLPGQAVAVLNDRVKLIGKINSDIADWLSERRRVEDAYVQGLRKLASRRQQDGAAGLGVFQTPWQSIVSSMESMADSHASLAEKIDADVERPLRDFQSKNREMQGISTIQGNLAAMAKELEEAQRKSEKLQAKGGRADTKKVSSAISGVQDSNQQWESQAPYVFEQLQALDESRVNHLRDCLTQLQTHEVDQLERSRITAESTLNAMLNVSTADEISTFVARLSGGLPTMRPRRQSRPGSNQAPSSPAPPTPAIPSSVPRTPIQSSETPSTSLVPPTPVPTRSMDDGRSDRSAVSGSAMKSSSSAVKEPRKGGLGGLMRLGTVMGRRKQDPKSVERTPSPEKRSRPSRNPLRRGSLKNMQQIPSPNASMTELPTTSPRRQPPVERPLPQSQSSQPSMEQRRSDSELNGDTTESAPPPDSSLTNGTQPTHVPTAQHVSRARPPSTIPEEAERTDPEGYSLPASNIDDITRAQQEAMTESTEPQFKLNIKNEPIREEDSDAQAALSNVANTLRAQAPVGPPQRKLGTLRGRRDVRNTIFVPNPTSVDDLSVSDPMMGSMTPVTSMTRTSILPMEDTRGADTQSIRSSHSLSSQGPTAVKHPEMHQPGLNASIIETVSAWFSRGQVTKATVIGEVALSYNGSDDNLKKEVIRLENFPVLEKVAPNPSFIEQVPSKSGEYAVDLSHISRTSLAFKYQVHLEEASLATHAPVILAPVWKVETTQTSVILNYSFNPAFASAQRKVSLQNVTVIISIENAKASTCLSKPTGTFSKEKSLIYWRLGDITIDAYAEGPQKLLARFTTDGEAKAGSVEARWEVNGEHAVGLGSGLGVSQKGVAEEKADPFADDGSLAGGVGSGVYKEVAVVRKIVSGKYVAN